MARWIPYNTTVSFEPEETEFRTIGGNYSIDDLPENVLERLPPSLSLALLDRPIAMDAEAGPTQLEFLRGKKVALVGCSLDRIAMISMCLTLGKGQAELVVDDHDFSSCYFKVSRADSLPSALKPGSPELKRNKFAFHRISILL